MSAELCARQQYRLLGRQLRRLGIYSPSSSSPSSPALWRQGQGFLGLLTISLIFVIIIFFLSTNAKASWCSSLRTRCGFLFSFKGQKCISFIYIRIHLQMKRWRQADVACKVTQLVRSGVSSENQTCTVSHSEGVA